MLEKEDFRDTEYPDEDPTCYDSVHNGRDVSVCLCTGDKCNAAPGGTPVSLSLVLGLTYYAVTL